MISEIYAMSPPAQGNNPASGGGMFGMLVPMIVIFGIMYFLIIRPQKRKEVSHRKFLEEMKKGDEVVTQSGVYGRIAGITDKVVTLEVADHVKIRVAKSSIAGSEPSQPAK